MIESNESSATWWRKVNVKGESMPQEAHSALVAHVEALRTDAVDRIRRELLMEYLYESTGGRGDTDVARVKSLLSMLGLQGTSVNIIRSIVDTLTAKISRGNPAIKCTADGANYSQKRKAEKLTKFLRGKATENDIQQSDPMVVRDALVTSAGCTYVGRKDGDIYLERVPRRELFTSEYEARYGMPRQLHRVRKVSREVLAGSFPSKEKLITAATIAPFREEDEHYGYSTTSTPADMVEVTHSWHLPSSSEASDGCEVISVDSGVLAVREHTMDTFPIAMLRWKQEMSGWWGRSLVAELASLQLKVDETLDTLLQNLYWTSSLTIFQMENQGYPPSHLMARRPNVVTHKGPRPPDYVTPSPFHPNAMQFLQMLIEWMYDMSGVSQQGAQAKNPLGAQASGTALMELYDQNSERFSDFETGFGIYRTDLAELQIARAKQIGAERDDFSAKWQDRTMMQRILWKDVDMERDQFVIRLEPSNFIPDTRAGKLATANELGQAGLVPQEYMSEMFSEPDIREANRVQNSPLRYLQWVMQKLGDVELDEDDNVVRQADYIPPDRSMDLELAAKMAVAEQHDAEAEEAPEPIVSRFRRFATATDALLSKMKAEAAAMAPPMPAADVPMDPTMGDPMAGAAQDVGLPPGEAPTALPGEAMPG